MKKIFFALAALVLAFTGCSQEEDAIQVSEKKAVKVVVNMDKPGFGEDTRAARTEWEDGDQVICTMGGPGIGILLTYNSGSWTTQMLRYPGSGTDYVEADLDEMLVDETGYVKAAYFSSGIKELAFLAPPTTTMPTMVITTNASSASPKMGECVMTCENDENDDNDDNGTYTFADGVLTLNITMVPQVAQFTIRDLSAGTGANTGKLSDGGEVGVVGLVTYSGGTITPTGIELNQVAAAGYNPCWVHPNTDGINPVGISIYAAVDSSYEPDGESNFIQFSVDDENGYYVRDFSPYATYKAKVTPGAAIIMDGPTGAAIAPDKWYEPA